jgi:hypothetical protein
VAEIALPDCWLSDRAIRIAKATNEFPAIIDEKR